MTIGKRVMNKDIDLYGHADYSSYLNWYKQGHQEFLDKLGIGFEALEQKYGIKTVVRRADIEYLDQLFESDNISIKTSIDRIGRTSMRYCQSITKQKTTVSKAKITVVFIDNTNLPTPIPHNIRGILE